MKKQALEIVRATKILIDKFGNIEEDLLALLLEKDLEKILGKEKIQGCWIRELDEGFINIGHPEADVYCKKSCSNSVNIYLKPFDRTGLPVGKHTQEYLNNLKP